MPDDLTTQLSDENGNVITTTPDQAQILKSAGYSDISPEQQAQIAKEAKFGSPLEQAKTAAEGAASTLSFGLSTGLEREFGVKPEDIRARREINPNLYTAAQIAGFTVPAVVTALTGGAAAPLAAASGPAVMQGLGEGAGSLLGEGIAAKALNTGVETALFQSSDEVSKMLSSDPNQSLGTAAANIGLSGLIGGGIGGVLGTISPLWKSTKASQLGQIIEDAKGRFKEFAENPDPVSKITEELNTRFQADKAMMEGAGISDIGVGPYGIQEAIIDHSEPVSDFQKRFTTSVNGERVVDPGKVNSLINQIGKPNAELKREMLNNFLDSSERMRDKISSVYQGQGLESPFPPSSLNFTSQILEKPTTGGKLADRVIYGVLNRLSGHALGTAIGGALGSLVSHPAIGAIVGERALGPFFDSIIPSIAKPLIQQAASAEGLKAATDYGLAVFKGENLINKAAASLFSGAGDVLPAKAVAKADTEKLDKHLASLQTDPSPLFNVGGKLAHYMPEHAGQIGMTVANAVNHLNSLRPQENKQSPLDAKPVLSQDQKASYHRVLALAQNPLSVFKSIKDGTLTPQDVTNLQAIYPGLYKSLTSKIGTELAKHIASGGTVPYHTRMSAALFMGQPLDSTMTPQAIQAIQSSFMTQPQPQQQGPTKNKRSTSSLPKIAQSAMTAGQAEESRKASRE